MEIFPQSILEPLPLGEIFQNDRPIEVDLGSGPGKFLIEAAQKFPERNFLGVERLLWRVRKTCRNGVRSGLTNLRVLRSEIDYTVRYMLPRNSVWRFHLYFPDPWPKRRHQTRRIANGEFFNAIYGGLVDGGELWIKTDHQEYFDKIALAAAQSYLWSPMIWAEEGYPITDFEELFMAKELPIYRLRLRKRSSDPR
jgi:tRNA (guanine-N7-)-methyltransferase